MNLPIAVWMMRSFLAEVPAGDHRGGLDRRGQHVQIMHTDRRADRDAGHRGDLADLLHLRLERAAVRQGAHQRRTRRPAPVFVSTLIQTEHSYLAQLCAGTVRSPAGAGRRVRGPGQAGAGVVARRGEVDDEAHCAPTPSSERRPEGRACRRTTGRRSTAGIVHLGVGALPPRAPGDVRRRAARTRRQRRCAGTGASPASACCRQDAAMPRRCRRRTACTRWWSSTPDGSLEPG